MKKLFIIFSILITTVLSAYSIKITGRISVIRPEIITIKTVHNKEIATIEIKNGGTIETIEAPVVPDVYIIKIGDSEEYVFLDRSDLIFEGFLDSRNPENSELSITGIKSNDQFQLLSENYIQADGDIKTLKSFIDSGKIDPDMISAIIYMKRHKTYENSKLAYDLIPNGYRSATQTVLKQEMDSLYQYRIGGEAPDFSAVNQNGEKVSLSDFRGKWVVLDFWASWCGPCRFEINRMKEYYPEFKDGEVVFISLSLDETKEEWLTTLDKIQIPWISLWTEGGFDNSPFLKMYGFKSIPFLVLIDKEGNVMERGIKGDSVQEKLKTMINETGM